MGTDPARRLYERLIRIGVVAFLDQASIPPGARWNAYLLAATQSPVVGVLVSHHANASLFVSDEIARVLRGVATGEQVVLPVLLDDAPLPYGLGSVQALHMPGLADSESMMDSLVDMVESEVLKTRLR